MHPESFSVRVPDEVQEDLRARLRHTNWPELLPYEAWSSGVDHRPGVCTSTDIPDLWVRLMSEHLGYARFGAQGQDIGAAVAISMGAEYADVVAGIRVPGVLACPLPISR